MKLSELGQDIGSLLGEGAADTSITHITHDSRKVQHGSIFVAIEGALSDGHDYIARASQLGAVAVVTNRPDKVPCCLPILQVAVPREAMALLARRLYGYPDRKLKVIGLTGTNGKTTITYLVNHLLKSLGKSGRIGTLSYYNGVSEERATRTTPEASELYRSLSEMVANGCTYVAMEISSHGLAMGRVLDLEVHYAIFTNLSQDHLDFHKTMEAYFQAKQILFSKLPKGSYAIVNWDDAYGRRLQIPAHTHLIRYGQHEQAELRFEVKKCTVDGSKFTLYYQGEQQDMHIPLKGIYNIYNFCGALAVALLEGVSLNQMQTEIQSIATVPGRCERVELGQNYSVMIDFAHTPDALMNVLSSCREITKGRLITVFGAGGDRDPGKRSEMGQMADEYAHIVVLTSDNPRTENPESIMDRVQQGIKRPLGPSFKRYPDREQAIAESIELAQQDDLVLITGKGHETYQEIGRKQYTFDDRQVAAQYIQARLEKEHG